MQSLHDRVLLRHLRNADGECHRDNRGQTLGDGRDRQRHRTDGRFGKGLSLEKLQGEDQHGRAAGDQRQALAQTVELPLEGRARRIGFVEQIGDATHFGLHARRTDQDFGTTTDDRGVHEHHSVTIAEGRVGRRKRLGVFVDRHGLAGQRCLVDGEIGGEEQPTIGGNAIARFQENDIAGDQILGHAFDDLAVPAHPHPGDEHALESRKGIRGPGFLGEAENRVDHEHNKNDDRVLDVAQCSGENGSAEKHIDDAGPELIEEEFPPGTGRRRGQPVQPVLFHAGGNRLGGETHERIDTQLAGDRVGAHGRPRHPFDRSRGGN